MALQGVQGSKLFELLTSPDKSAKEFLASLKSGDTLRGKVVDSVPSENKAVINFKGHNIVSKLPDRAAVYRGDTIDVTVSRVTDRVFMRLSTSGSAAPDAGAAAEPARALTAQQIAGMLNSAKVPVNEQNIYIAQKLIDYHMPVNAKNINDINSALNRYMQSRGVDMRAFNIETPAAAKEIALTNLFKLSADTEATAGLLNNTSSAGAASAARQEAAGRAINMLNTINTISSSTNGASVSQVNNTVVLNLNNAGNDFVSSVINNMMANNLISGKEAAALLSAFNRGVSEPVAVNNGAVQFLKNGESLEVRFNNLLPQINNIAAESAGNKGPAFDPVAGRPAAALAEAARAGTLFKPGAFSGTGGARPAAAGGEQAAPAENTAPVLSGAKQSLIQGISNTFNAASRAITSPGNTSMTEAVRDTSALLNLMNSQLNDFIAAAKQMRPAKGQEGGAKFTQPEAGVQNIKDTLSGLLAGKTFNDAVKSSQLNVTPSQFMNFRSQVTSFLNSVSAEPLLQQAGAEGNSNKFNISVLPDVDVRSTIESLAFLKSRNISTENNRFIDIMGKYFRNDMKLNQNMEELGAVMNRFDSLTKGVRVSHQAGGQAFSAKASTGQPSSGSPAGAAGEAITADSAKTTGMKEGAQPPAGREQAQFRAGISAERTENFVRGVKTAVNNLRALMENIAIKTDSSSLQQGVFENQVKNFIQKSGLNMENNIKEIFLQQLNSKTAKQGTPGEAKQAQVPAQQARAEALSAARDNLKAALLRLGAELNNVESHRHNLSQPRHETMVQMRETVNDVLTNLNALQFMNHKPVSFDMFYTQIPVMFGHKFFNGELKVWYRKGSVKENIDNKIPVNLMFMLNTTNLGAVKVNVTLVKNEVECRIDTENERAKQILTRGRNNFLKNLHGINYSMKAFNIKVEEQGGGASAPPGDGYIELGRINMQA